MVGSIVLSLRCNEPVVNNATQRNIRKISPIGNMRFTALSCRYLPYPEPHITSLEPPIPQRIQLILPHKDPQKNPRAQKQRVQRGDFERRGQNDVVSAAAEKVSGAQRRRQGDYTAGMFTASLSSKKEEMLSFEKNSQEGRPLPRCDLSCGG